MLAAAGAAGWLPFDRRHSPAEWRAIRLRLKEAVFAANLARALRTLEARGTRGPLGRDLGQVLIVGGPAGDDELLGVLLRTLPEGVTAGRGNVGGTLAGPRPGTGTPPPSAWPWPRRSPPSADRTGSDRAGSDLTGPGQARSDQRTTGLTSPPRRPGTAGW